LITKKIEKENRNEKSIKSYSGKEDFI